MRQLIASSLVLLACASSGYGEEVLREISWSSLKEAGQLPNGELQRGKPPGPQEQLKIENPGDEPRTFTILVLEKPGISASQYALVGQVRCEGVQGKGYLEMWNHFADGKRFFSKTLGSSGPLRNLEGSCPWRPFALPFHAGERPDRPTRLVLNVVLPGRGTVYLSPLRLVQHSVDEHPVAIAGTWWDDRTGGLIGGILGTVLGCLGGLIGTMAGTGKCRGLTIGLAKIVCLCGVFLFVAGGIALLQSQPYGVWYPLVLTGILSTSIMGGLLPGLRRRYQQIELRKMTAADANPPLPAEANPVR